MEVVYKEMFKYLQYKEYPDNSSDDRKGKKFVSDDGILQSEIEAKDHRQ